MGTRALPDMYALSPWACGPRASGIHIRQSTCAHVVTITYHTLTVYCKFFDGKIFDKCMGLKTFNKYYRICLA